MIKNRSFQSKFVDEITQKHQNPIKSKVLTKQTMMSSGGVTVLDGDHKEQYEKFFGVALPKIKIHKTADSILKSKQYHAHSYAQGNNIYLGKDVRPIDTVEGQTVVAHEITHVLQQKYLDMSSSKEMIDPSVELEQKAQMVEQRVRETGGIEKSSGNFFRKWDVLPQRSYLARSGSITNVNNSNLIQRLTETKDNEKNFYLYKEETKFDEGKDSLTLKMFSSENKAESSLKWGILDENNNPEDKLYKDRESYVNQFIPSVELSASTHNTVLEIDYKNSLFNDDISEASFQSVGSMHVADAKVGASLSSKGVALEGAAEYAMYKGKLEGEYALNIPFSKYQLAMKGAVEGKAIALGANASGHIGKHNKGWGVSAKLGVSALLGLGLNSEIGVREDPDFESKQKENQEFIDSVKAKYNQKTNTRLMKDASYAYKPNEFYKLKPEFKDNSNPIIVPYSADESDLRRHSNEPKNIDESKDIDPALKIGEKTVLSKVDSDTGLETFMSQKINEKHELSYKLVFRGTWPQKFSEALEKHDESLDFTDVIEDGYFRGTRQATKAKEVYQKYFTNISTSLIEKYDLPVNEISFTGHSLGGYLANSVMLNFIGNRSSYGNITPKSFYAETYNALGLTTDEYYAYEKAKKDSKNKDIEIGSFNHRTEYDPVSRLGVQPGAMLTHKLEDDSAPLWKKIVNAHSMDNFTLNSSLYKDTPVITKDKPNFFDRHIVDNNLVRSLGVTTIGLVGGVGYGVYRAGKWGVNTATNAVNYGVDKAEQFRNFASNTASHIADGAIGIKDNVVNTASKAVNYGVDKVEQFRNFASNTAGYIEDRAIGIKDNVVNTASKAVNYGVDKAEQFRNFASNTASHIADGAIGIKDNVVNTASKAVNYGVDKAEQFRNFASNTAGYIEDGAIGIADNVVNTASKAVNYGIDKAEQFTNFGSNTASHIADGATDIGSSIATGAESAYNFAEDKIDQFGNTVSEGWDSFKSLFAETGRHQNQKVSHNGRNRQESTFEGDTIDSLNDNLDELSMKIFRKLKSEITLEYARSR